MVQRGHAERPSNSIVHDGLDVALFQCHVEDRDIIDNAGEEVSRSIENTAAADIDLKGRASVIWDIHALLCHLFAVEVDLQGLGRSGSRYMMPFPLGEGPGSV